MKRFWLTVFAILLVAAVWHFTGVGRSAEAASPAKKAVAAKVSCRSCHADYASVLPKGHPPAKGTDLSACTSCHAPDMARTKQKNPFSYRMHRAHIARGGSLDCMSCHTWTPGKSFGLIGQKGSWGAPKKEDMELMKEIFGSWAGSDFTDNLHARAGIACTQCHGRALAKADDTVENSRCLTCHGPLDQLAKKSEPKDFKDRNPHKSHLGDIACTVCHKGHAVSKVYCLDCHQNFVMKIPGGGKK